MSKGLKRVFGLLLMVILLAVAVAGCGGDNSMSVSACAMEAGQIRIGSKVGIIESSSDFWGKPTVVTVINDEVTVTDWPII